MTTHDFRPGDVVTFKRGSGDVHAGAVLRAAGDGCMFVDGYPYEVATHRMTLVSRPAVDHAPALAPTEHPSRSRAASSLRAADPVDHPAHYTDHPSGVECITVTEHMNFNVGNAVKYLWRAGRKGDALTDLRKAAWYVNREIERLTREGGS